MRRPAHEKTSAAENAEAFEPTPIYEVESEQAFSNAPVAMRMVEDFIVRHMKPEREGAVLKTSKQAKTGSGEEKQLFIDPPVNQYIWSRGIEKPPSKVRVRALKFEDGSVIVHLAE